MIVMASDEYSSGAGFMSRLDLNPPAIVQSVDADLATLSKRIIAREKRNRPGQLEHIKAQSLDVLAARKLAKRGEWKPLCESWGLSQQYANKFSRFGKSLLRSDFSSLSEDEQWAEWLRISGQSPRPDEPEADEPEADEPEADELEAGTWKPDQITEALSNLYKASKANPAAQYLADLQSMAEQGVGIDAGLKSAFVFLRDWIDEVIAGIDVFVVSCEVKPSYKG